ncbi:MAG TPA: carboxypeptidase regulatory-like domain-containing protein [Micromonosporaceae bacterium]|nr:carboxypeptidase regulatory-like domain-containing protein [Micromonosporaceae bacterium]
MELNGGPTPVTLTVSVTSNNAKVACNGTCSWPPESFEPGAPPKQYEARFRVSGTTTIGTGESATLTAKAADAGGGGDQEQRVVALKPPDGPKTVTEVSGYVRDLASGRGISDAIVGLLDSVGHNYTTTTNSSGYYRFVSSPSKPISPGTLTIGATKDGYSTGSPKTVDGRAGQAVRVDIRMESTTAPTTEATLSPAPETTDTGGPLEEAEESVDAVAASDEESGGGGLSWMLIILGGLLVALGVGAIVLLVLRRRDDSDEDDDEDEEDEPVGAGRRGGLPPQAGRSTYRSGGMEPAMPGRGGDQTMLARPGMADAPTMMQARAGAADYGADPYGGRPSPRPPQPGYAGPGPVYGAGAPAPGYPANPPGAYGSPAHPSSPAGYPSASRGGPEGYGSPAYPQEYGADRGYGSAAGGYAPNEPARYNDGYGDPGYGPSGGGAHSAYEQPGYGQDAGYPAPPAGGPVGYAVNGGYGSNGGDYGSNGSYGANGSQGANGSYGSPGGYSPGGDYGSGSYPAGGYGADQGYDPRGYDAGGYDRGAPPDQRGGYEQPGYGQGGAHYDEPTGRRAAAPQHPSRGDGRQLGWLDDT